MKLYLLEDFTAVDGRTVKHPTQAVLDQTQIIEAIGDAHTNQQRIRVHIIGPCLLDWTNEKPPPASG